MPNLAVVLVIGATILSSACGSGHRSTRTGPSGLAGEFAGAWAAPSTTVVDGCGNLEWNVLDVDETTISGELTATCAGNVQLTGTIVGTLVGEVLEWTGTGNLSGPGMPDCLVSLTGTARREGESIRVDYVGTTCLGPISGSEILHPS